MTAEERKRKQEEERKRDNERIRKDWGLGRGGRSPTKPKGRGE